MSINTFLNRLVQRFTYPQSTPSLVFAYGSGVFKQSRNKSDDVDVKKNMVDLILSVDDPCEFHAHNISRNGKDYSLLMRMLGHKRVASFQDNPAFSSSRMFFNTLIKFEDRTIKYGVISTNALISDLLDWNSLYSAGRLHKPVLMLNADSSQEMLSALRINLQNALHTSLLMLPETFTEEDFYLTLCGLSYAGDFRMLIGEDKDKVRKIVSSNIQHFRNLYAKRLNALSHYVDVTPGGKGSQDKSSASAHDHLNQLPKILQQNLLREWNMNGRYRDMEDVLRALAFDRDADVLIRHSLERIVRTASITQAGKGILSAGGVKSIRYSSVKLYKMFKSMYKPINGNM